MIRLGIYAAVGAVIGSLLRFTVSELVEVQATSHFPWPTFLVNVVGAFAIGLCFRFSRLTDDERIRAFIVTGLLGGFTTFSALAVETTELITSHSIIAGVYVLSTFLVGTCATALALGKNQ